jgi:hypothetical protein
MAPTASSSVRQAKDYSAFKRLSVHTVRIVAHSLGVQVRGAKSENHLSIYLLLGQNRSYHMDMRIAAPTARSAGDATAVETVGQLDLQGRAYLMSNSAIKHVDLEATGRPVEDFVNHLLSLNLQYFRFTFTDGHNVGCRSWV